MKGPLRVETLRPDHPVANFDRGQDERNRFLKRFARTNQQTGAARTYVAVADPRVVGYSSLAVGEVAYDDAPARLSKGLARHPVPILLLARLAVRSDRQGRGVSGPVSSKTRCGEPFRRPRSPAFEPLPSTPRTRTPGDSTSTSG